MKKRYRSFEGLVELKRGIKIHNHSESKDYVDRIMSNTTWIDCPNYKEMRL